MPAVLAKRRPLAWKKSALAPAALPARKPVLAPAAPTRKPVLLPAEKRPAARASPLALARQRAGQNILRSQKFIARLERESAAREALLASSKRTNWQAHSRARLEKILIDRQLAVEKNLLFGLRQRLLPFRRKRA